MSKIIGIDLGTTNSVAAVMEGGKAKVIPTAEGSPICPSIVAISKNGERLVGQLAKRQSITNPTNTIYSVKRLIGRRFSDAETREATKHLPYKIVEGKDGGIRVVMGDKEYSPEEVSAMILQKLKVDAEAYLGEKVDAAVITVPAYFNDSQRQATKDAGAIAGLDVKRIINEPTASSLAYGLDKEKQGKIVVFDLGGGTFDVTVLEVGDGVFEVKSTSGDTFLGGDDFDRMVMDWIVEEFKKHEGIDIAKDSMAMQRIKEAAEKAKVELSTVQETEINLPFITADASGPKHLVTKLTRAKLEQLVEPLIERLKKPVEQALSDAKLKPLDINNTVLVGGMTRMPKVQELAKVMFGKEPDKGVNPDEVVALGAAIQGAVLGGEVKDVLLLDVTPLTLGIETLGGVMTPLVERNTTVPVSKSQIFSTAAENQTQVEIHVLQGERPMSTDNRTLGRFILDGIPPAPRGVPQVEVTFDIDANGILNVKALDKATNKEQKITITATSSLSKEEVEKLKKDAEIHATEDTKKRELVDTRNLAENLIYTAEKTLKDVGDKAKPEDKRAVEDAITALKGVIHQGNAQEIKDKTQKLSAVLQQLGAAMYEPGQSGSSSQSGGGQSDSEEKPEESKDEEKS